LGANTINLSLGSNYICKLPSLKFTHSTDGISRIENLLHLMAFHVLENLGIETSSFLGPLRPILTCLWAPHMIRIDVVKLT